MFREVGKRVFKHIIAVQFRDSVHQPSVGFDDAEWRGEVHSSQAESGRRVVRRGHDEEQIGPGSFDEFLESVAVSDITTAEVHVGDKYASRLARRCEGAWKARAPRVGEESLDG